MMGGMGFLKQYACEKIMAITMAIDSAVGLLGFLRDH